MIIKKGIINNFYGAIIAVGFICFSYGNSLGWSSPVEMKLMSDNEDNPLDNSITSEEMGWINSIYTIGASVGCWVFALMSDLLGRRPTLIIIGLPVVGCYSLMIFIRHVYSFYAGRFLLGFSIGGILTVTCTYNTEIPPKNKRGFVFAWANVSISLGTLFAYCVGPYTTVNIFNFILLCFPSLGLILAVIFCEESPYYWSMKNKTEKAKKSLYAFRPADANIDDELKELEEKIRQQYEGSLLQTIKTKAFMKAFALGNILLIFQQLTGIFAILMYNERIFHKAGSKLDPAVSSIIIGTLFFISGSTCMLIIEHFKRKTLLIASSVGMIISEVALGIFCILDDANYNVESFKIVPLLSLGLFIFTYKFGNGPVTWVVSSELYPTRAKSFCLSFSVCIYFLTGSAISKFFPIVVKAIGLGPVVLIFAACCLCSIFFVLIFLIETKGKTLGEIQDELRGTK